MLQTAGWTTHRQRVSIIAVLWQDLCASCKPALAADWQLKTVTVLAVISSIASFIYSLQNGLVTIIPDAMAHLEIAHRIIFGRSNGIGELGYAWLWLQHAMALPFVVSDQLYYSGLAGSYFSMICYVATVVMIYKVVKYISDDRWSAMIAAVIFGANANILYMQSTPMGEIAQIFFLVAAFYALLRWSETPKSKRHLFQMCAALALACSVRYESWFYLALFTGFIAGTGLVTQVPFKLFLAPVDLSASCGGLGFIPLLTFRLFKQLRFGQFFDKVVIVAAFGGLGVTTWVVYCLAIFHNPVVFWNGQYASPSNWVSSHELAVHNLTVSLETYGWAIIHCVSLPILIMSGFGVLFFAATTRLRKWHCLYLAWFAIPLFVYFLYSGSRPLHVLEIQGENYNVRFALIVVPAAAIFVGYLSQKRWWMKVVVIGVAGYGIMTFFPGHITTINEPQAFLNKADAIDALQASDWLRQNFDHSGFVLLNSYGNERALFNSRLPTNRVIDEYDDESREYTRALNDPSHYVNWVFARKGDGGNVSADAVWTAMQANENARSVFDLVFSNNTIAIFHLNEARNNAKLGIVHQSVEEIQPDIIPPSATVVSGPSAQQTDVSIGAENDRNSAPALTKTAATTVSKTPQVVPTPTPATSESASVPNSLQTVTESAQQDQEPPQGGQLIASEQPIANTISAPTLSQQMTRVYIVQPHDTLVGIATAFYGDPHLWPVISRANTGVIKNPNLLYIGVQLVIPPIQR